MADTAADGENNGQFASIWADALAKHAETTGHDLKDDATPKPTSTQSLLDEIDKQQTKFSDFRAKRQKLFHVLDQALKPIELIGHLAQGAAQTAFPPASVVFSAVVYLTNAAHGVSSAYDAIIDLFSEVKDFTTRLSVHTRQVVSPDLREIITRILVALISLCDTAAKLIKDGRVKLYVKNVWLGKNEKVQEELAKLRHPTDIEEKMVSALSFVTVTSTSKVVNDVSDTVISNQSSLDELKEQISSIARNLDSSGQEQQDDAQLRRLESLRAFLKPTTVAAEIQDGIARKLVPGTGNWLLEEPAAQSWLEGKQSLLWLTGGPGAGKSFISSAVIRYMEAEHKDGTLLAYFFCRDYDPDLRSFKKVLRSLAYQLAQQSTPYTKHCLAVFRKTGEIHTLQGLWQKLFLDYFWIDETENLMLLIDGIDEALQDDRIEFFELLDELPALEGQSPVRLLMVGRPELGSELEDALADPVSMILVSASKTWREIGEYVSVSIAKIKLLQRVSDELRKEIVDKLIEGAEGMFLWVDLMIKELATKRKIEQIRQTLSRAPKGLSDTLRHVLERFSKQLDADDREDLNELLAWVVCAKRPLQLGELDTIMKLKTSDGSGNIYLEGDLRKRYASFFHVTREDGLTTEDLQHLTFAYPEALDEDKTLAVASHPDTTLVHLAHASIGDFFRQDEGSVTEGVGVKLNDAEILVVKSCLRLWCEDQLWDRFHPTPFADYATSWWPRDLERIDRSKTSPKDKAELGKLLIRTMCAEMPILRWSAKSCQIRSIWEYEDGYCKLVHDWLTDPDAAADMDEEERGWLAALTDSRSVFKHVVMLNGTQWLKGSIWVPELCFQSTWAHIQKNKSLEGKADPPTDDCDVKDVTAAQVFEAARWFGFEEDARWHARVARVMRECALSNEAIEEYKLCIALDEQSWIGWGGLGFSYVNTQNYEAAIENWEKALELVHLMDAEIAYRMGATKALIYAAIGDAYRYLGKKDALDYYKKALDMQTMNGKVVSKILRILDEQKDYEQMADILRTLASTIDNHTGKSLLAHDAYNTFLLGDSDTLELSLETAVRTDIMCLVRDNLQASVTAAKKMSQMEVAAKMQHRLALILLRFFHQEERAVQLWEQIMDTTVASSVDSELGSVRIHTALQLAMRYFARALAGEFDHNVRKLESLSQRRSITDSDSPHLLFSTRDSTLALGKLYQMTGDEAQARECFRSHIKYAIELLHDDDPSNDWQAYHKLTDAFRMSKDDAHADAAYLLDAACYDSVLDGGEQSQEEWLELSKRGGYNCDAHCGRKHERSSGYHVCRMCLDVGFCDDCIGRFKAGDLPYSVCDTQHEFYVVPQLETWIMRGKVKYKDEWITIEDWIDKFRVPWGL